MAKNFKILEERMSAAQREAVERRVAEEKRHITPLLELRQARNCTQKQLAESLHIKQASVSKIEHQTDMYLSTLRRFIEAMGGKLHIEAEFPEGKVTIDQFDRDFMGDPKISLEA